MILPWHLEVILFLILAHHSSELQVCGKNMSVYSRAGSDVTMQCVGWSHTDCKLTWTYQTLTSKYDIVEDGQISKEAERTERMRLEADCSLHISYVTAEDVGLYTCKRQQKDYATVNLSVIEVKASIPESERRVNQNMTLHCHLHTYDPSVHCIPYQADFDLRWTGSGHYDDVRRFPCNTSTKVTLTRNHLGSKVFCKLSGSGVEMASVAYTTGFSDEPNSGCPGEACQCTMEILGLVVVLAIVGTVVVCGTLLLVCGKRAKCKRERQEVVEQQEAEEKHMYDNLNYARVNPQTLAMHKKRLPESESTVIYSLVN